MLKENEEKKTEAEKNKIKSLMEEMIEKDNEIVNFISQKNKFDENEKNRKNLEKKILI